MKKPRHLIWMAVALLAAVGGFLAAEFVHRSPSFNLGEIEFPRALREKSNMPVVEVLFATNRKLSVAEADPTFTDDVDGELHYGRAEVRIPASYTIGDTQRPEVQRGVIDEDHAVVESVEVLAEPAFRELLAQRMAGQEYDGATLFVHGMNHSFDSAVRQAGALYFALNLRQPMVLFSWPTQPALSIDGYRRSPQQVDASGAALEKFLEPQRQNRFDLLAHSLGCKVVCRAFSRLMVNDLWNKTKTEFPNVILAAPDADVADFTKAFLSKAEAFTGRTTIYVARNDRALVISDLLNDHPRLGGLVTPEFAVSELLEMTAGDNSRVEIIDATFVNNEPTSHGYFYQSRPVFSDIYNLLRNDLPASERQLYRHQKAKEANYWIIPP